MPVVAPAVTHLQQVTQYDCWHAALRMMVKWPATPAAEPQGTHTDWLYARCRNAQNDYDASVNDTLKSIVDPTLIDQRNAGKTAAALVQTWARTLGLRGGTKPYQPFARAIRPGLTIALAPMILGENRLRAVRGATVTEELDGSAEQIGAMLTTYGPLYCLVGFGHVVVVTGITGTTLDVCDPMLNTPSTMGIGAVVNSPCVARRA